MNKLKNLSVKSGASAIGAGVGILVAGPVGAISGAIMAPVVEDVLSRALSLKEKTRIERVKEFSLHEINRMLKKGAKIREDLDEQKAAELFEGVLLKAKNTYEEKKLPYIANLFATAPFTNTPIDNLLQALITADQLSYRQFCILEIYNKDQYNSLGLSKKALQEEQEKLHVEIYSGVYQDIVSLILLGLLGQDSGKSPLSGFNNRSSFIAPSEVRMYYPGELLCNAMKLGNIPESETNKLIELLKEIS